MVVTVLNVLAHAACMRAAHLLKVINGIYLDVIGFEKADNVALLSFFLGIISLLTNAYYAVSDVKKVIRQDAEEKPFSYVGAPPPTYTHTRSGVHGAARRNLARSGETRGHIVWRSHVLRRHLLWPHALCVTHTPPALSTCCRLDESRCALGGSPCIDDGTRWDHER